MKSASNGLSFQRVIPNLIAFSVGLGAAWFLEWETTDLVWSLWLSSLVVGYLTVLITIGSNACIGTKVLRHGSLPKNQRTAALLGGTAFGLFMLAFFSLHFCGFHSGHAVFLSSFFPVQGMPEDVFFNTFVNPIRLWKVAFTHLMPLYGVFLIATIIVERKHLLAPFIKVLEQNKRTSTFDEFVEMVKGDKTHMKGYDHPMARPYVNVIRMHILIFFFAGVHALKIDSFLVYAVVYAVYFFPWSELFRKTKSSR